MAVAAVAVVAAVAAVAVVEAEEQAVQDTAFELGSVLGSGIVVGLRDASVADAE